VSARQDNPSETQDWDTAHMSVLMRLQGWQRAIKDAIRLHSSCFRVEAPVYAASGAFQLLPMARLRFQ
jgi:hypothetical protein